MAESVQRMGQSKKAFLVGQVSVPNELGEHKFRSESKSCRTRHSIMESVLVEILGI